MCACVCICAEARSQPWLSFFRTHPPTLHFETGSLPETWDLRLRLGFLASEPLRAARLFLKHCCHKQELPHLTFFMVAGIELGSLRLYSKHFTD